MGFGVDVGRLHNFSDAMGIRGDDSDGARSYAASYLEINSSEGEFFGYVFDAVNRFREAIEHHHLHVAALSRASSAELARAARYYERTDDEAAAAADATFAPPPPLRPRREQLE